MQIKEVRHRPPPKASSSSAALPLFRFADSGPGSITVEEFARVMKESGQNPSDDEMQDIIKEVDLDGDGTINFDGQHSPIVAHTLPSIPKLTCIIEFISMMTGGRSRHSAPEPTAPAPGPVPTQAAAVAGDSEADYEAAWKEFDPSLKCSITAAQFRQLMAGLGENVTDAEVDELIGTVDAEDKISCKFSFLFLFLCYRGEQTVKQC
jgi:calmodulin